ncbi:DUF2254 domain-containing protein [Planomicrobium sp. CPCC 101079]|uniref:DUF2254 domain-containing protein n=1 Tax=Planomicrobium sp. CPCC 101079 TaxID=2599618 RepID=UPI0021028C95|nr:DUF2254 domain-containing protein [Planomicrobium sp. CPCC 101079]
MKKIWITPALYSLVAIALSIASFNFDLLVVERFSDSIPRILLTNVELGKDIMGVLAAAILTMTTFTFSTVLVVLTTYTSQFSPRSSENFINNKVTRRVLGIFVGGFVYASLSLLYMQDKTFGHEVLTPSFGVFISFLCVATFAYYIHFISSNVRVTALINKLVGDIDHVVSNYKKMQEKNHISLENWEPSGREQEIEMGEEGYVQFIDLVNLVKFAEERDIEIEVLVTTGDYVYKDMPIFRIYQDEEEELALAKFFQTGPERTVEQDIGYSIQKLMEVAIRAISPSLNDPNTANEILIRIGRLLGEIGQLKTKGWVLTDSADHNRLVYHFPSYDTLLYHTFFQISKYGSSDISVMSAMTESLKAALRSAPVERHDEIWEIQEYILDGLDCTEMKKKDVEYLQKKVDELAELTNQQTIVLQADEKKQALV